jgi:hypothetical protein
MAIPGYIKMPLRASADAFSNGAVIETRASAFELKLLDEKGD